MSKILIAGALDFSQKDAADFVQYLGEEIIEQGHTLMSGCLNELDKAVADSAYRAAHGKTVKPAERIISYAVEGSTPVHHHGTLLRSKLRTWGLEFKRLEVPEPMWIDHGGEITASSLRTTMCRVLSGSPMK